MDESSNRLVSSKLSGDAPTVKDSESTIRHYLQLVRLPNVFTALADVMMGFLFVHRSLSPIEVFVCLALASVMLYMSGMVLNDVWDVQQDRAERPRRPLPSGAIPLIAARRLGFGLWVAGLFWGWLAGLTGLVDGASAWRAGLITTLLALLVLLYDRRLKRTALGPLAMGACRMLNVLLGMAVAASVERQALVFGFDAGQLLAAGGIGLYVAGLTWFARTEGRTSNRLHLAAATVTAISGLGMLALIHQTLPYGQAMLDEQAWFLLLGVLGFFIARRFSKAVADPTPQKVQLAVTSGIWSLIMLDAAVALLASPPMWSIVIIVLLVPTMVIGRWIKAT